MPYTIDPSSADCYPCTSVLINKFDLRSQQELDRVEAVLVTAKAAQWEESPLCSTFDFEHYKAIHRHLFCDLYEWAGVPRSINISKKGTQFCPADEIPRVSSAIFRRLAEQNFFQSLSFDDFVDAFVDFYIRTNELHPFREGNGRSMRIWLDLMLKIGIGQVVDWSKVDKEDYLLAMERSPIKDVEIKVLLKAALTDDVNSREVFMKGIDHSYYYEGYTTFKAEEL